MKKYEKTIAVFAAFILVISLYIVIKANAAPIDTYHESWVRIKDSAAEDGSTFAATLALDSNEGNFANILTGCYRVRTLRDNIRETPHSNGGAWVFAFYGTDAENETFSFTLVGWARDNGMAQVICEGDGILGSQDVVIEPNGDAITNGFWADTINLDETTKWPSVAVYNSGDNQVANLVVDLTGLEWVNLVTYDVGGGAEASSIGVYGRNY